MSAATRPGERRSLATGRTPERNKAKANKKIAIFRQSNSRKLRKINRCVGENMTNTAITKNNTVSNELTRQLKQKARARHIKPAMRSQTQLTIILYIREEYRSLPCYSFIFLVVILYIKEESPFTAMLQLHLSGGHIVH